MADTPPPAELPENAAAAERLAGQRWHRNLLVLGVLLPLWFVGSFVCGIFFVEELNATKIGEAPLGFWFAHQGSIYLFVVLIFVYAVWMDRIEPAAPKGSAKASPKGSDLAAPGTDGEGDRP